LNKQLIAILLMGLVVTAVVGCGTGDDSDSVSITKAEFIVKTDKACAKRQRQLEDEVAAYVEQRRAGKIKGPADYEELVSTVLAPAVEGEVDDIRSSEMPGDEEERIEIILAAMEEGLEKAKEDPGGLVSESNLAFDDARRSAEEYGFKVCGRR
jgi:hypothetical protein